MPVFNTQTSLEIKVSYEGEDVIANNISIAKIKYKNPDGVSGEFEATNDPINKLFTYSLPVGSPLSIPGIWSFWNEAIMSDGRNIVGSVFKVKILREGSLQ